MFCSVRLRSTFAAEKLRLLCRMLPAGGAVAGRDYNTVELSEHTFREFYLPAYKAGIDAGAAMVMTSFNTINGVPASTNK